MPASHEAALRACLTGAARRLRWIAAAHGTAAGLTAGALLIATGLTSGRTALAIAIGTSLAVVGAITGAIRARRAPAQVAARIEQLTPASRNLIQTSAELLDATSAARPMSTPAAPTRLAGPIAPAYIVDRVLRDAAAIAATLDLRALFPARRAIAAVVISAGLWSASVVAARSIPRHDAPSPSVSESAAAIQGVHVEIVPPDYAGVAPQRVRDPQRIEALAGSRLQIRVEANAATVDVETIAGRVPLTPSGPRTFTGTLMADADGFVAIAPHTAAGGPGLRRLIGLTVTPDAAPRVRIVTPGHDLRLPAGTRTVNVAIEAEDDLGLRALRLAYTRVSGSGEHFTFTGGEVPVSTTQTSGRAWTATAAWLLAPLALEPGDMVIYRAIAADHRPGAPAAESDAFIVEIAGPGSVPSDGFSIDDQYDRYAISQQMVIVKTERLLAERRTLSPDVFLERSRDLAAEQRQVRAEFVFMMGGELADEGLDLHSLNEEAEAAGEDDLAAGRLANQGRADLMRAIRSMSRAAGRLFDAEAEAALPIEKDALTYLQRAFSRSRYILRTLGSRAQLDLTRRLTGLMSAMARDSRPAVAPAPSPRITALRAALAGVAALAADPARHTGVGAGRAVSIAQQVMRIDPASADFRGAMSGLAALGDAGGAGRNRAGIAAGPEAGIDAALDQAASGLAALIRAELLDAPMPSSPDLNALAGALADALRREGRR